MTSTNFSTSIPTEPLQVYRHVLIKDLASRISDIHVIDVIYNVFVVQSPASRNPTEKHRLELKFPSFDRNNILRYLRHQKKNRIDWQKITFQIWSQVNIKLDFTEKITRTLQLLKYQRGNNRQTRSCFKHKEFLELIRQSVTKQDSDLQHCNPYFCRVVSDQKYRNQTGRLME